MIGDPDTKMTSYGIIIIIFVIIIIVIRRARQGPGEGPTSMRHTLWPLKNIYPKITLFTLS